MKKTHAHQVVLEGYAQVAEDPSRAMGPQSAPSGSCDQAAGTGCAVDFKTEIGTRIGYTAEDLHSPASVGNLGLGCGNPTAIAELKPGEVVVDLGSGAGFDALLAARQLGDEGRFIGVDMTPEMLERARTNAVNAGFAQTVEFREGLIEALPVTTASVDVVISNCVINLSPDKSAAFREAFRVLKSGGRLAVSDILLTKPLPRDLAEVPAAVIACIGSAETEATYLGSIRDAGFVDIEFSRQPANALFNLDAQDPVIRAAIDAFGAERTSEIAKTVFSYTIQARKP